MIYIQRIHLKIAAGVLCLLITGSVLLIKQQAVTVGSNSVSSRYTVVIDAGHGGKDAGTIGIDGAEEKGINLAIAQILYDYLSVCGIRCVMTRYSDEEYYPPGSDRSRSDLYNRLDLVNSIHHAVLLSIHQNHFDTEKEWGTQIWYSANNAESRTLADSILSVVKQFLQPENQRENKVSDSSYYLLYRASVPSIMVECGFMSNSKENQLLQDKQYQSDFAYCVLLGVCEEV